MPRNSHGKPAFFRKKESLAKKANCRAAPLSRLDRRFFGKKAWQKTQWSNIRVNVSFARKKVLQKNSIE
ncbi:MAG: hypothetical protein E7057_07280 [Lentisphaerae bacterium]|nr:hypothetical protein [Lentisphaerota bacterium]